MQGKQVKKEALSVKINEKSIMNICNLPIEQAVEFFNKINLTNNESIISKQNLKEIKSRLEFLLGVGLNYLNLNRKAEHFPGENPKKISNTNRIQFNRCSLCFRRAHYWIAPKGQLPPNQNFIQVARPRKHSFIVEHDEDIIRKSDWIIDIGPAAGIHGGK